MPNMLQAFFKTEKEGFTLMAKPPFSVSACDLNTQTPHTKNYNMPRLFLMFRGIEYDFWLLRA